MSETQVQATNDEWPLRPWVTAGLLGAAGLVIHFTSGDEGQLFGRSEPMHAIPELSSKLLGHTLTAVHVAPGTADLTLQFGNDSLQAVADSSGYEAWQVNGPEGIVAVGQGGGNVAVFG